MMNERLEQLINRRLDGELTESESLELDKMLIRSPEARALFEDYQQMDSLAGECLRTALTDELETRPSLDATGTRRTGWHTMRQWVGLGAAAALIALILAGLPWIWKADAPPATPMVNRSDPPASTNASPVPVNAQDATILGHRNRQQHITRNIIGVMDEENQSLYLLEVQREDTTVQPVSFNY